MNKVMRHKGLLIILFVFVILVLPKVVEANYAEELSTIQEIITPEPFVSEENSQIPRPVSQTSRLPVVPYLQGAGRGYDHQEIESAPPEISPYQLSISLQPGQSYTATVSVFTGATPISKGDIMFLFDRTGSMGGEIGQAKVSAIQIMNAIRQRLPDAWFGVGSFMDYPACYIYPGYSGCYGDPGIGDIPWELDIQPTSVITDVANSINALWLGYGNDEPEDYTRVLYEVQSVAWRTNSKKIAMVFGDAPTHDLSFGGYNYGGDPGRDAIAETADDLDFETVVQQVADEGISVIAVDSGNYLPSEATFKGMSIGYDTSSGTDGLYFNLQDSNQIPTATVQLIISETQVIDHLSIQVTDEYVNWVRIEPSEYQEVGSNITKTFTVVISVPTGTATGFYPFALTTIGDGTILGMTHVDVTVPSDSPISDLGFRPDPNGFEARNFGSTQTWEMFRQYFGADQVEHANGNRIHAADEFFILPDDGYRDVGKGGSCFGFSGASLINWRNLDQSNAGKFAMSNYSDLFDETTNEDMREAITFYQGTQKGLEISSYINTMCTMLDHSPNGFYRYLKSLIQNNSPSVIAFTWDEDYYAYFPKEKVLEANGGHAVVPYRFEEPDSNHAYVYVYDSNIPGNEDHRFEFDLADNTWSYRWPVPLWPDIVIEGDASKCQFYVIPIDLFRYKGVVPWSSGGLISSQGAGTDSSLLQLFTTSGPAKLLFTDDEGRRLGWDGAAFYDEIPGATYIPTLQQTFTNASGLYYINPDIQYDLKIHGTGEGQANISAWSSGHLVEISNLEVVTGTVSSLNVSADGGMLTFGSASGDTQLSLSVDQILAGEDRNVTVGNLAVSPGEVVALQLVVSDTLRYTDTVLISTNSPISRTYDLSMQRSGGSGYSVFGHQGITLDPNSNSLVMLNDWSTLSQVDVLVDLNKDGIIDEVRPAENETQAASIFLEAYPTTVHTGRNLAAITVEVRDQYGAFTPDGTVVKFFSTLGTLSIDEGMTSGGLIHLTLTSGSQAGTATISAIAGSTTGFVDIAISNYVNYLPLGIKNQP